MFGKRCSVCAKRIQAYDVFEDRGQGPVCSHCLIRLSPLRNRDTLSSNPLLEDPDAPKHTAADPSPDIDLIYPLD
ncbi:MAG: hypothetical protein D6E12_14645 [Desulfovibrio sp.]|nr:MAG: hypothetical protein D6E12_14645 [Desulfovibrio sp.]